MGKEIVQLLVTMTFPSDADGSDWMCMLPCVEIGCLLGLAGSGAFAADLVLYCPNESRSCCGWIHWVITRGEGDYHRGG